VLASKLVVNKFHENLLITVCVISKIRTVAPIRNGKILAKIPGSASWSGSSPKSDQLIVVTHPISPKVLSKFVGNSLSWRGDGRRRRGKNITSFAEVILIGSADYSTDKLNPRSIEQHEARRRCSRISLRSRRSQWWANNDPIRRFITIDRCILANNANQISASNHLTRRSLIVAPAGVHRTASILLATRYDAIQLNTVYYFISPRR